MPVRVPVFLIHLCFSALIWMSALLPAAVNGEEKPGAFCSSGVGRADYNTCQTALPVEIDSCSVQLDITDGANTFDGPVENCSGNPITGVADAWAMVTIPGGNLPEQLITIQYDNSGGAPVSDIALSVYTDCNDLAGSLMGCVDALTEADGVNVEGTESIQLPADAGENFYIRVINKTPGNTSSGILSVFFSNTTALAPIGPFCVSAAPTSLNTTQSGITGNWSGPGVSGNAFNPATAGAGTHTLTFTPDAGQCATENTLTVVVNANCDDLLFSDRLEAP